MSELRILPRQPFLARDTPRSPHGPPPRRAAGRWPAPRPWSSTTNRSAIRIIACIVCSMIDDVMPSSRSRASTSSTSSHSSRPSPASVSSSSSSRGRPASARASSISRNCLLVSCPAGVPAWRCSPTRAQRARPPPPRLRDPAVRRRRHRPPHCPAAAGAESCAPPGRCGRHPCGTPDAPCGQASTGPPASRCLHRPAARRSAH